MKTVDISTRYLGDLAHPDQDFRDKCPGSPYPPKSGPAITRTHTHTYGEDLLCVCVYSLYIF